MAVRVRNRLTGELASVPADVEVGHTIIREPDTKDIQHPVRVEPLLIGQIEERLPMLERNDERVALRHGVSVEEEPDRTDALDDAVGGKLTEAARW